MSLAINPLIFALICIAIGVSFVTSRLSRINLAFAGACLLSGIGIWLTPHLEFPFISSLDALTKAFFWLISGIGFGLWLNEQQDRSFNAILFGLTATILLLTSSLHEELGIAIYSPIISEMGTPISVNTHWGVGPTAQSFSVIPKVVLPWLAPLLATFAWFTLLTILVELATNFVLKSRQKTQNKATKLKTRTQKTQNALRIIIFLMSVAIVLFIVVLLSGKITPPALSQPNSWAEFAPSNSSSFVQSSSEFNRFSAEFLALFLLLTGWPMIFLGSLFMKKTAKKENTPLNGPRLMLGISLLSGTSLFSLSTHFTTFTNHFVSLLLVPMLGGIVALSNPNRAPNTTGILTGIAMGIWLVFLVWQI